MASIKHKKIPRPKQNHLLRNRLTQVKRNVVIGAAVIISLLALWFIGDWLSFVLTPARQQYTFGTSFSPKQSEDLGLDWKANYDALLDDLGIRQFRLMSYWDRYEPQKGVTNFDDLDWQMNEAAKRGAKVTLAIGLRQPRWPECHEPAWATTLDKNAWKQALYDYTEIVVKRYQHHPALESFQLENEALAWWFGDCRDRPDPERINEELRLVKTWTTKPVWMNLSDQYGISVRQPIPDAYGYSLYLYVYNNIIPGTYINPSPPIWFHLGRAKIIASLHHKPFYLHELQMEPWGPKEIKRLTEEEQNTTMSPKQIHNNLEYARKIGFDQIYTWGSEWWYWRKVHGDNTIWDTVKQEIRESR